MITMRALIKTITVNISILFLISYPSLAFQPSTEIKKEINKEPKAKVIETYGRLPLYFIKNDGQIDEKVKYYEKGSGHSTYFTEEGIYLSLVKGKKGDKRGKREKSKEAIQGNRVETEYIKLCPLNMEKGVEIIGESRQEGKVNYFIGNDPEKWRTEVPTYRAVVYRGIYKGIDIKFYGNHRQLEYDIIVKPGAEPSAVRFAYEGAEGIRVTEIGDLEISLKHGKIIQRKPHIYQEVGGKKVELGGRFKMLNPSTYELESTTNRYVYGFEVAKYDRRSPLIIDPVLAYSTYLGGDDRDAGCSIALDSSGSAYVAGRTYSTDFSLLNPYQTYQGNEDAFVTKINPGGNSLAYSTYLGGSGSDWCEAVAVDSAGAAYVTGHTQSTNFPTVNSYQTYQGNEDAFVTKINPVGNSLAYSTYLGGSAGDGGYGIAVDSAGAAYVTGFTHSTNFPLLNPYQTYQGDYDAFVTKFNPGGNNLAYSTYLGGSNNDFGFWIAVDSAEAAYVTGYTESTNFPTVNPYQTYQGGMDAFVTKINPVGNSLAYSTYLGGSSIDIGWAVAVDSIGAAYVTGYTFSTNFPTVNPYQTYQGLDAFVTKLNPAGSALVYSTYLGGSDSDEAFSIAVDTSGSAYITGRTYSTDFPLLNHYQTYQGNEDAFVTKINPVGNSLAYSTYLGGSAGDSGYGIAVDSAGAAYVTGGTESTNFPTVNSYQTYQGDEDAFVTKLPSTISVLPTYLDFGNVTVRRISIKSMKIYNNGTADLVITISGLEGTDFRVLGRSSFTVKAQKSYNLRIKFKPSSVGLKTATLRINSNDPDMPVLEVPLSGKGQ